MLLRMESISKRFFGVHVLSSVDFELKQGEAHALIGLNGAGKSTLINMVSGLYEPDSGNVFIEDAPVRLTSPYQAQRLGVVTIHQAPVLVPNLSIAENIFLGMEPKKFKLFTDFKKIKSEVAKVLEHLGYALDPDTLAGSLSLGEQYVVAVAKSFVFHPKILILDEPTVGLSEIERDMLMDLIRKLKRKDTGIIYITHRLSELPKICDRVTILRDGKKIVTCAMDEMSQDKLIETMCGREVVQYFPEIKRTFGREILRVERLSKDYQLNNISFALREGEVIGVAGLAGSGKAALAKTIFGQMEKDSGHIYWRDKEVCFQHPYQAIDHDFGYLHENRIKSGLFMEMGVTENLTIASLNKNNHWQLIKLGTEQDAVIDKVIELDIKVRFLKQQVKYLSGGNQQKILLGRWMMSDSELYILEEPTQGIDIASKSDIYLSIRELAEQGKGIIVISSDLKELVGVCSRIIVMHKGSIMDEMSFEEVSEERILRGMTGETRPA